MIFFRQTTEPSKSKKKLNLFCKEKKSNRKLNVNICEENFFKNQHFKCRKNVGQIFNYDSGTVHMDILINKFFNIKFNLFP